MRIPTFVTDPWGRIRRVPGRCLVWLVAAILWERLWVYPTMANDDLYFMVRNNVPPGQLTASLWWQNLWTDLLHRNGRTADVLAQLVFDRGPLVTRLVMAGLCWGLSLMVWLWVREFIPDRVRKTRRGRLADAVAMTGALLLPTATSFWDRRLDATTLYFMSATVGYVGGLVLFLAATLPWLRELKGRRTSRWYRWASLPLMVVTCYHHEILGLLIAGFGVTLLACWPARRWPVSAGLTLGAFVAVGLLRLTTPGLRARQLLMARGRRFEPLYLEKSVSALAHFQERHWPYLLTLTVSLLLVGFAGLARGTAGRIATPAAMTAVALSSIGWCWLGDRTLVALDQRDWHGWFVMPTGWPLVLFAATLWLGGVLTVLGACRTPRALLDDAGALLLVPFTGIFLAAPIPFSLRAYYDRSLFFLYAMVLISVLGVAVWVLGSGTGALGSQAAGAGAVLVAGVLLCPGAVTWQRAWGGLRENHDVWSRAQQDLLLASDGQLDEVVLPRRMPRRDYTSDWPGVREAALPRFRVLYGIDDSVPISWAEP
ncbi:hypothetical protein AAEX63_10520 [Luteococcus sp. H138]|uniref:hypothetical protein n=1 Tax=unclassified Luteococcus TaxID=2639923 RepID=UPI00313CA936